MGAFGYADDIILMSPTKQSMENMLRIAKQFSLDCDITFNKDKTKLLVFSNVKDAIDVNQYVIFDEMKIMPSEKELHLGNIVGKNDEKEMVVKGISDFYKKFNYMYVRFNICGTKVKYKLFKSLCMSLYGMVLWELSGTCIYSFYCAWRKCIRKLFNLPYRTRSHLLPYICNDDNNKIQVYKRFQKFSDSIINSNNICVSMCAKLSECGSQSTVSDNMVEIKNYNFNVDKNVEYACIGQLICDIIDNEVNLSQDEKLNILQHVCTDE